jgi:hypothetical protein
MLLVKRKVFGYGVHWVVFEFFRETESACLYDKLCRVFSSLLMREVGFCDDLLCVNVRVVHIPPSLQARFFFFFFSQNLLHSSTISSTA